MKVLIAGGTSWFGQTIVQRLVARGNDVVCLDENPEPWRVDLPRPVTIRQGSVADLGAVTEAVRVERPEAIINRQVIYGVESEERLLRTADVNIMGPLNVFEVAATAGVPRVVYESSIGVYGTQDDHGDRWITEADARLAESPYVFRLTQHAVEEFARRYAEQTDVEIVGTRPSVCHSPLKDKGISSWSNDFVTLPAIGEPMNFPFPAEQRTSLIWVDEAAEVFARLADQPDLKYDMYNSGGFDVSLGELADLVREFLPDAEFSFADPKTVPAQPMPDKVSSERAQQDLGIVHEPLTKTLVQHANQARKLHELPPLPIDNLD